MFLNKVELTYDRINDEFKMSKEGLEEITKRQNLLQWTKRCGQP